MGGGYRVRPGYRLPPLMLAGDEAVAVVLGLLATRSPGPDDPPDAASRALAKINRVLPATLRRQVEALGETVDFTSRTAAAPPEAGRVLLLADAIRRRHRLQAGYRSFTGDVSERELSPWALVVRSACWYLVAHDHRRDDRRTFRVDRMGHASLAPGPYVDPPPAFDAVAHLTRSLAGVPGRWQVEVVLDLPVDEAARRIRHPRRAGRRPPGTRLRMPASSPRLGRHRPRSRFPFHVHQPTELRRILALADRLGRMPEAATAWRTVG